MKIHINELSQTNFLTVHLNYLKVQLLRIGEGEDLGDAVLQRDREAVHEREVLGDQLVDEDKRRVPTGPNPLHNR